MTIQEVLALLWRRKLIVLIVTLATIAAAVGALRLVTPIYESSSTLVLRPTDETGDDFSFFYALEQIVPIYANAATTSATYQIASDQSNGEPLGSVSVQTYRQSPILGITGRDDEPEVAQRTAQAITDALIEQVDAGRVGLPSLELTEIDRAGLPSEPVFPRTMLTLFVAGLIGLALGVAAAFLRESMTSRVESAADLSTIAGVPVYAEIAHEPRIKRLHSAESLARDPEFRRLHEGLRDLRTNLHFSHGSVKSIVVTSPAGRHGKTTISFGLAVTYARAGLRTLLVDGDLRRGRMAEMLNVARGPGLIEILRGSSVDRSTRKTTLSTLHLITRGDQIVDPGELLQAKFPALLRKLEEKYDVVVIDATPLVPVNDARVMASAAEATLIVVSAVSATRRQVRAAMERLSLISVAPTAAVLNHAKTARGDDYDYVEAEPSRRRVSALRT